MKRLLISAALVALGASTQASAAFVASPITIDRDGAGGTSAIKVTSLNWLAGNTLTVGALGQAGEDVSSLGTSRTLDTYYQAALNTFVFNSSGGSTQYLNTPGSEWTLVAKIKERATGIGTTTAAFVPLSGTVSIFYHAAKDANDISGLGYDNGLEILRGSIVGGSGNYTDFTRLDPGSFPVTGLDAFGGNNRPGVGTNKGSGQSTIKVDIGADSGDFIDTNFFLSDITSMDFALTFTEDVNDTGQLVAPFAQGNPSALVAGVAPSYSPGNATFSNGINGADCAVDAVTGKFTQNCDFHFQTTNVTSFTAVPEPGALALAGLGLSMLSFVGRRRKQA